MFRLSAAILALTSSALAEPVSPVFAPAPASAVRLLEGPFKAARDKHAEYLLGLSADRLLARFWAEAGLAPKAEGYGGWEADTIGGHTLGHYLSGCAKMYAGTGDERFKARVAYVVDELAACQEANTRAGLAGYAMAVPGGKKVFAELKAGEIRSKGFDLNGLWVPWYTLHKEMAGLRDAYALCGNEKALTVWRGLGDFAWSVVGGMTGEQLNRMLRCEHGGMNEVAADLYAATGERRYLELAERFCDWQVLDPMAAGKDVLPGLHANTQVPKFIGAARLYEVTGEEKYRRAAEYFWETVTRRHSYANGGNSLNEYFGPADRIAGRLNGNTSETCNTYNMMKLTRHIHGWRGEGGMPAFPIPGPAQDALDPMIYYERAMYSHILASQDPGTARVVYYTPLRSGSRKDFQRLEEDFTCCVGSGMENHASYGDAVYATARGADGVEEVVVDLFVASELTLPGVKVTLETRFPDEDEARLRVSAAGRALRLKLHHPWWSPVMKVTVDGEEVKVPVMRPAYVEVTPKGGPGAWKAESEVRVTFSVKAQALATPDDRSLTAVVYGPVLMAGRLGAKEPAPRELPVVVTREADGWFERVPGERLELRSTGAVKPSVVTLVPFFRVVDEYYTVYWRTLTTGEWEAEAAKLRAEEEKRRALEARTVDFVQPGEMQPERDHGFEGDRTNQGEHRGLRWRDAYRGGWFSFRMKGTGDAAALRLVCTYWGDDAGDREFDILVDGVKVATQVLERNKPGEFFDVEYDLPAEVTKGKTQLVVKFSSTTPKTAGGVFGVRVVRREGSAP